MFGSLGERLERRQRLQRRIDLLVRGTASPEERIWTPIQLLAVHGSGDRRGFSPRTEPAEIHPSSPRFVDHCQRAEGSGTLRTTLG